MFRWHRSLVLLWLAGSFQSAMGQDEEDFPDDQDQKNADFGCFWCG